MNIQELLTGGGGLLLALMTLIQLAPVKINPWSALGKALSKLFKWLMGCIGRAANRDVLAKLNEVSAAQQETQKQLDRLEERMNQHIKTDDNRDADAHRMAILQFNNSLLRNRRHTKEEFNEVLAEIDYYEDYCREHEDYSNNLAVLAIENIRENYKERLRKHDFLQDGQRSESHDPPKA